MNRQCSFRRCIGVSAIRIHSLRGSCLLRTSIEKYCFSLTVSICFSSFIAWRAHRSAATSFIEWYGGHIGPPLLLSLHGMADTQVRRYFFHCMAETEVSLLFSLHGMADTQVRRYFSGIVIFRPSYARLTLTGNDESTSRCSPISWLMCIKYAFRGRMVSINSSASLRFRWEKCSLR